jgi:hypothetical protein
MDADRDAICKLTPPPKPPRSTYTIANGGVLHGVQRVVVLREDVPILWTSGKSLDEAWKTAEEFITSLRQWQRM